MYLKKMCQKKCAKKCAKNDVLKEREDLALRNQQSFVSGRIQTVTINSFLIFYSRFSEVMVLGILKGDGLTDRNRIKIEQRHLKICIGL